MRNVIIPFLIGLVAGGGTAWLIAKQSSSKAVSDPLKSEVVFSTNNNDTEGYYFPTHDNLLVMDRSNAEMAEAFIVQIAPGKFTHRHIHDDTEQLFYVLSGKGKLVLERLGRKETFELLKTNFVHVPRNCYHQTFCEGTDSLRYLAIDCFPNGHNPNEPTWDDHARAVCNMNKWDYTEARKKKN
jgi:oxalate decarboxylase/phosphoglucose isomerase-like protein (cupin superfamily)